MHKKSSFTHIRPIDWSEVFTVWKETESHQARWQTLFKERGFATWEEWRSEHVAPLKPAKRVWNLYKITDPLASIPTFYAGPHKTWQEKYYNGKNIVPFAELAQLPAIQRNEAIVQIADHIPSPTTLIGIQQQEKTIIIEGMHRCSAIALMDTQGKSCTADIFIALTDFSHEPIPQLSAIRKT